MFTKARNQRRIEVLLALLVVASFSHTAKAQSLSTIFNYNNANTFGGNFFFDLNVLSGITITSLETNVGAISYPTSLPANTPVNLEVYTRSGTANGFQTSPIGWTLVSSGSGLSQALNIPTVFDVSDFFLGSGITGIKIRNIDYSAYYTNGTGSNQVYSNADFTLTSGSATNNLANDQRLFTPRVWNGTINYTTSVTPELPGAALLLPALLPLGFFATKKRRNSKTK